MYLANNADKQLKNTPIDRNCKHRTNQTISSSEIVALDQRPAFYNPYRQKDAGLVRKVR